MSVKVKVKTDGLFTETINGPKRCAKDEIVKINEELVDPNSPHYTVLNKKPKIEEKNK